MKYILLMLSLGTIGVQAGKMYTPLDHKMKVGCMAEHLKKGEGHYICDEKGNIHCIPGWENEENLCQTPMCDFNGATCKYGNCSEPHVCTCEVGWAGQTCDHCVCLSGCVHGYCNNPFECICDEGWEGIYCDKPTCGKENGDCVHGYCSSPGVCTCHPGYTGDKCEICETYPGCVYGYCDDAPFQCKCFDGYTGFFCDEPICSEGCHPDRGSCLKPNECWCKAGWRGPSCSECVPYWNCVHGTCNKPFECNCEFPYKGMDCNSTVDIDGNWGQWGAWSDCNVTCISEPGSNGVQIRQRLCNDPVSTGTGKYCSHDGSKGTETRPCTNAPVLCSSTIITTSTTTKIPAVDGGYTEWTVFSPCTAICSNDTGHRRRKRFCTNPEPSNGGLTCLQQGLGPAIEDIECQGDTPEQNDDPTQICFNIGSK